MTGSIRPRVGAGHLVTAGRRRIGQRYELFGAMAAGGTATVHLGRLHGTAGFMKPIAIKRLHPHLAADPILRTILVEEARLVSRISHPNVVAVHDIVEDDGELFLVLEYVHGATISELTKGGERWAPATAIAVMRDALTGLHAAHHARDASGALLGLVHRDVSPRNVIVTTDGIAKVLDFGIAKARARQGTTRDGHVRGSLPYMAPEQLADEPLTSRTDVYGAAVVLWEMLTGARLFTGDTDAAIVKRILDHDVRGPSTVVEELPRALDAVLLRGLARDPEHRFGSGLEMALALEESLAPSRPAIVADFVMRTAEKELARRQALLDAEPGEDAAVVVAPAVAPVVKTTSSSRVSSTAPVVPMVPWRKWAGLIAVGIVAVLVAARYWDEPAAATAIAPSTTTGTSPSTVVPPPASVATEPVAPSAVESAPPRRLAAPVVSAPRATGNVARDAAPAAAAGHCVPYFVDSAGVRRFNRECLE